MYQEPLVHLQAFLHLLEKILGCNCHESKICKEGKKARLVHAQQVSVIDPFDEITEDDIAQEDFADLKIDSDGEGDDTIDVIYIKVRNCLCSLSF